MFVVPCFIAVLTGRRISDVLRPFETKVQAIGQCHAWTLKTELHEEHVPGYEYWAQYGGADDTVRVEHHIMELDDSDTEGESEADSAEGIVLQELRSLTRGATDCAQDKKEVDA